MKPPTLPPADLAPEVRIRQMLAFSLCEENVSDADELSRWSSIDCVEAVIHCERSLGIAEVSEEKLIECATVGALVAMISESLPKALDA